MNKKKKDSTITTHTEWYFLRFSNDLFGETPWRRVTRQEFIAAERQSGFYPKGGGDHLATGGFVGNTGSQGRVVSPAYTTPESWDWDPVFQTALREAFAEAEA